MQPETTRLRLHAALAAAAFALLLPLASHAQETDETEVTDAAQEPAPRASLFRGEDVSAQFRAGFAKGFDAVVLRPLGALKTGVGLALFVPAALLASPEGWEVVEEGWELLVVEPAEETFERPLGDF